MNTSTSHPIRKAIFLGAAAFSLFHSLPSAQAVVVANYDFPVAAGASLPSPSTDVDAATTASSLSFGAGIDSGGISVLNASDYHLYMRPVSNSTEALAFSSNKFFTFTVTPGADPLSFTSLNFDYEVTSSGGRSFALYASPTNSFVSNVNVATGTLSVSPSSFLSTSIDLSGVTILQSVTTATTFRLYVWGATGSTDLTRFDNISVNAVPENGPATLLGVALMGIIFERRKRKSQVWKSA